MQPLLDRFNSLTEGRLGLGAGIILLAVLLAFLLIEAVRALLRMRADRAQQSATMGRLRVQLQEVRLRCEEAKQAQLQWNGYRKFEVFNKVNQPYFVCGLYSK